LGFREIRYITNKFSNANIYESFFSVPAGVLSGIFFSKSKNILTKSAFEIDKFLANKMPKIGLLYRNIVIQGSKI